MPDGRLPVRGERRRQRAVPAQVEAVRRLLRLPEPQGRGELRVGRERVVPAGQVPVPERAEVHRPETEMRPSEQLRRQQRRRELQ